MTIGGIITGIVLTLIVIIIVIILIGNDVETLKTAIGIGVIGVMCIGMTWFGIIWYYNHTESGKRAVKTQESNFGGGITREVKVYDVEGDVIAEYKGKFDIEYDNDRILFDDEKGNRHIIYYPTGTVIVDEVSE